MSCKKVTPINAGDPSFYASRHGFTTYKYNERYFRSNIEITEDEANDNT